MRCGLDATTNVAFLTVRITAVSNFTVCNGAVNPVSNSAFFHGVGNHRSIFHGLSRCGSPPDGFLHGSLQFKVHHRANHTEPRPLTRSTVGENRPHYMVNHESPSIRFYANICSFWFVCINAANRHRTRHHLALDAKIIQNIYKNLPTRTRAGSVPT